MHCQLTPLVMVAVFENINPLPCPERKPAMLHWNGKLGLGQGCFDMRRHIVGSLAGMAVRTIPGRDTCEKIIQVAAYIGIGILLDGE